MMKSGRSVNPDPVAAVEEIHTQINNTGLEAVLFFCSSHYDLNELAAALNSSFSCPVVGCTSSGEICARYQKGGIVAIGFSSEMFSVKPLIVESLSNFDASHVQQLKSEINSWKSRLDRDIASNTFAICLLDGLSVMEEVFLAKASTIINTMPLIGGSAGDDLSFKQTHIFYEGKFTSNSALLLLVNSRYAFETFRFQHFKPSSKDMVITSADPSTRIVYEIDGSPAAEEYARILGLPQAELTPQVFSTYPVMLQIGESWYVRSIQKVNSDGSLTFFCAIDEGLPMTIADGAAFVETLQKQISELKERFEEIVLTIGFDCILRKLEIEQKQLQCEVEDIINQIKFFGFSTYGEQFNTIHVNQTLTGVIIGKRRAEGSV